MSAPTLTFSVSLKNQLLFLGTLSLETTPRIEAPLFVTGLFLTHSLYSAPSKKIGIGLLVGLAANCAAKICIIFARIIHSCLLFISDRVFTKILEKKEKRLHLLHRKIYAKAVYCLSNVLLLLASTAIGSFFYRKTDSLLGKIALCAAHIGFIRAASSPLGKKVGAAAAIRLDDHFSYLDRWAYVALHGGALLATKNPIMAATLPAAVFLACAIRSDISAEHLIYGNDPI